jgi:hypothetical protein
MVKYILLGGHIHKAQDGGKAFCEELIKGINNKTVKILDCIFARPKEDWDDKFKEHKEFFSKHIKDFQIKLALPDKFIEQIRNSDVIFLQGGIPYQFYSTLENNNDWIKEIKNKTLVGTSGGADIISKYYGVGKIMKINEGLGILPIKLIPHWKSDYGKGLNIDWDKLLQELKDHGEELPVYTLAEGEFKVINT